MLKGDMYLHVHVNWRGAYNESMNITVMKVYMIFHIIYELLFHSHLCILQGIL